MPMPHGDHGPFITYAVFCDDITEDESGCPTLVGVHQVVGISGSVPAGPVVGTKMVKLAIALECGDAEGTFPLTLDMTTPGGVKVERFLSMDVRLRGPGYRASLERDVSLLLEEEGVYWFDVRLGERLFTRISLRAQWGPQELAS